MQYNLAMLVLIPPDLEAQLLEAAKRSGVAPEEFAVARVREALNEPNFPGDTLLDRLRGFIGTVEGDGESWSENTSEKFANEMVKKHRTEHL